MSNKNVVAEIKKFVCIPILYASSNNGWLLEVISQSPNTNTVYFAKYTVLVLGLWYIN